MPPSVVAESSHAVDNMKSCRMLYRTAMIGPDVQLIVLDVRGDLT